MHALLSLDFVSGAAQDQQNLWCLSMSLVANRAKERESLVNDAALPFLLPGTEI